ncbi:unnamed protein product [Rhizophagus irregularis]|nr:unnamed protein product [Rhizophagus irregularis]
MYAASKIRLIINPVECLLPKITAGKKHLPQSGATCRNTCRDQVPPAAVPAVPAAVPAAPAAVPAVPAAAPAAPAATPAAPAAKIRRYLPRLLLKTGATCRDTCRDTCRTCCSCRKMRHTFVKYGLPYI